MVKNEKVIQLLKTMIVCVSRGDYYTIKELSNLELENMEKEEMKIKQEIKKIKETKKFRKYRDIPLENWEKEKIICLAKQYSLYIINKVENSNDIEELKQEVTSIEEFAKQV